jgi:hypothetical protein
MVRPTRPSEWVFAGLECPVTINRVRIRAYVELVRPYVRIDSNVIAYILGHIRYFVMTVVQNTEGGGHKKNNHRQSHGANDKLLHFVLLLQLR